MSRPEISLWSMVNEPPGRVAATVQALRELDLEVVLGVDDRVDPEWIDGYRQIADRVLVVPFPGVTARLYAWLCEQCSGRWILQLDADEVPSPGLAAEVAEVIAAQDVTHAWMPCRWLYPDAGHYLAQWPWRPGYVPRLFRNDCGIVRFPALCHHVVSIVGPRRFMREPIYHADLVLNDLAAREVKCERYERWRPGMVLDGRPINEAFYLPERVGGVRTLALPGADAAIVAGFMDCRGPPDREPTRAPAVVLRPAAEEVTSLFEGRSLGESAYHARLDLLDDDLSVVSGEFRTIDIEVSNRGDEHWPGGMDAHPQIRVAYRWVGAGGALGEGLRTGFGAPVRPGERAIVPMEVLGPDTTGRHELEIDLVHEHVRWFGVPLRASIDARAPGQPRSAHASPAGRAVTPR